MLTASFIIPIGAMADSPPAEENIVKNLPYTVETGVDLSYNYGLYPNPDKPGELRKPNPNWVN